MANVSRSSISGASPAMPVHFHRLSIGGTSTNPMVSFHTISYAMAAAILRMLNSKFFDISSFYGLVDIIRDLALPAASRPVILAKVYCLDSYHARSPSLPT